jgi:hypothetical protein
MGKDITKVMDNKSIHGLLMSTDKGYRAIFMLELKIC